MQLKQPTETGAKSQLGNTKTCLHPQKPGNGAGAAWGSSMSGIETSDGVKRIPPPLRVGPLGGLCHIHASQQPSLIGTGPPKKSSCIRIVG